MRLIYSILFLASVWCSAFAQGAAEGVRVVVDTTFTHRLFVPGTGNVTGADGVISIPMDDHRSIFLWGDSFYGEVDGNTRPSTAPFISGNALTIESPDGPRTVTAGTPEAPTSLLTTGEKDGMRTVLWPAHGFCRDGMLHLFLEDIVAFGNGTFDFYWHSIDYARLSLDDFSLIDMRNIPSPDLGSVHFGFACIDEGKYVITYGSKLVDGNHKLYVARSKYNKKRKSLTTMEYWNGRKWSTDTTTVHALEGDVPNMSEQFSVFKYGKKYILLTQAHGTSDIYTSVADHPWGPWRNTKKIFTTPEAGSKEGWITYNAMAHHQYIENNMLLVGYCVNTLDFPQLWSDVTSYRPRFFWVNLDDIIK